MRFEKDRWIYCNALGETEAMVKHLVDIDDSALSAARAELGTATIADTVNAALCRVSAERSKRMSGALDVLAKAHFEGHDGWR